MAIEQYRSPQRIRVDNGPEFISGALSRWCTHKGIQLDFIEPGKPTQNAYIERFNKSFRYEVLDVYAFTTLDEARDLATWWMWVYNRERSHSSLGDQTPWIIRCHWRKTRATKALPGIVNKSLAACSPALETCSFEPETLLLNALRTGGFTDAPA